MLRARHASNYERGSPESHTRLVHGTTTMVTLLGIHPDPRTPLQYCARDVGGERWNDAPRQASGMWCIYDTTAITAFKHKEEVQPRARNLRKRMDLP